MSLPLPKYRLMINQAAFKSKEECMKYIGLIKNNHMDGYKSEIKLLDANEIAEYTKAGHTIIPAVLNEDEPLQNKYFKEQQIFGLDIDNANGERRIAEPYYLTSEKIKAICDESRIAPIVVYETFSSTPDWKRYRLLFAADKPIFNVTVRQQLIRSLLCAFRINGIETADANCIDEGRVFFAGHTIVEVNPSATINAETLIMAFSDKLGVDTLKFRHATTKKSTALKIDNPMVAAIKKRNVLKYRKLLSKALQDAANPHEDKDNDTSNKDGTINFKNLLKDYCSVITQGQENLNSIADFDTFLDLTSKLPLHIFLGLPLEENFCCILPGHEDKHPSASIQILKDGRYAYNCWGCIEYGHSYDLINVFARIMNTEFYGAYKFICEVLNIISETEWQKTERAVLDFNIRYLKSKSFMQNFPNLYSELRSANAYGQMLFYLEFAREHLSPQSLMGDDRLIFFLSVGEASKLMIMQGLAGAGKTNVHRKKIFLCELGLMEKVKVEDIPPDILIRAIKTVKDSHGDQERYRQDFLYVPQYTPALFHHAEAILKENKASGKRRSCLCREQILRSSGKEVADSLYTQDIEIGQSLKTEKFYLTLRKKAAIFINNSQYTTERLLLASIKGYSDDVKKKLFGICLPQLLKENGFKRVRVNQSIRSDYSLPSKVSSNSFIYVSQ